MRLALRCLALAGCLAGIALLGTALYAALYSDPDPVPRAAAIVVLSGPGGAAERPVGETLERVRRGVALYREGAAPIIVMSGGTEVPDRPEAPGAAHRMAALAVQRGVPADRVLAEARSFSTLQNAWFTAALPEIDPGQSILLVTHRYHLPRAWASFRWAGFADVVPVAADAGAAGITWPLLAEAAKWPANLLRAGAASAAVAAGAPEDRILPWLR